MMRLDDPNLPEPAEEEAFKAQLGNLEELIQTLRLISDERPDGAELWEGTTAELQRALVETYGALKRLQRVH